MTKNRLKLGLGVLTVLATPIAVNTVASSDALAAQGWVKTGNAWYFYKQNGTLTRKRLGRKLLARCRWENGNKCMGR